MRRIFAGFLFLTLLLTGCGRQAATPAEEDGTLKVYASFYTMYDFAAKIGGDRIVLENLMPPGAGAHGWEPSAKEIIKLENADVFVYNGAELEHWTQKVLDSLSNESLLAVETSKGIRLMERDGHGHEDGEEEDSHSHDLDPHVWLSPKNAKQQMEAIQKAFSGADPENADYYRENYEKYAKELDILDGEFQAALSALPKKEIVVSHEAFGYLCGEYGLTQVGIEGIRPDFEPNPGKMAEIIDFVREHDVKVIFFEELASPKVAGTIAAATGAKTGVLSPLENLSDEQRAAGGDYFSVMRENLKALVEALE